ncbi:MAG: D-glycero-beta-D-manno-heptose-7-phosphate kinase [Bdellovibrionales bacterium]
MTQLESKKEKVLNNLNQLQSTKVLIVGDIGVDEYVNGQVKRISPEAPVPVLDVFKEEVRLGLAANVAQNIRSLGGDPILISVIGEDSTAKQLCELLGESGVDISSLKKDTGRPTTRKLRVMSGHHHIVRVDYENKIFVSDKVREDLFQEVSAKIDICDVIILQDYAKGVLSEELCQKIIKLAKSRNKLILIDPNRNTPISFYQGADLMTPNLDEAIALTGGHPDEIRDYSSEIKKIGDQLMAAIKSKKMVVTRSQDGMSLFEDGKEQQVPTFARKVSDVTGAGDTVIAAMSLALGSGFSLEESCILANYAAGVVVGKIGCVPCSLVELRDYMGVH